MLKFHCAAFVQISPSMIVARDPEGWLLLDSEFRSMFRFEGTDFRNYPDQKIIKASRNGRQLDLKYAKFERPMNGAQFKQIGLHVYKIYPIPYMLQCNLDMSKSKMYKIYKCIIPIIMRDLRDRIMIDILISEQYNIDYYRLVE